ncbi:hypothetical protein EI555_017072, partial [Monodon monoceros]
MTRTESSLGTRGLKEALALAPLLINHTSAEQKAKLHRRGPKSGARSSPELCPIANPNPTSGRQGVWIGERYGRGSTWKRYTRD